MSKNQNIKTNTKQAKLTKTRHKKEKEINIEPVVGKNGESNILEEFINDYKEKTPIGWDFFFLGYLNSAKLLVEKVLLSTKNNTIDLKEALYLPVAFYSFKHSLELLIKSFCVDLGKEYQKKHELLELLKDIRDVDIIKKINHASIKLKIDNKLLSDEEIDKFALDEYHKITDLINKYFFEVYIIDILGKGDYLFLDTENELFRYPLVNSVAFKLNPRVFSKMPIEKIKRFAEDINKLHDSVSVLKMLIKDYTK